MTVSYNSPEINSAGGRFGFLAGSLFTEPFCQGTFASFFLIHSTGQTQDPQNHAFTQPQLMQMFQTLQAQESQGSGSSCSAWTRRPVTFAELAGSAYSLSGKSL